MLFEIFRKFFGLYFCLSLVSFGQVPDNLSSIEMGQTDFPIERPFTISVIIPNSDTRPTIAFPTITGFTKKGIVTSVTPTEINGKTIVSQVITQNYQARAPGRFQVQPFSIIVNGETIYSEGAELLVRPSPTAPGAVNATQNFIPVTPEGAAFLSLRTSKSTIYTGESVALTLSFFVADNYPYVLNFTALDKQLQTLLKKIRPANSWEENVPITDLKPIPAVIGGKKFREYRIYQSVFFPLSNQPLRLPAVSLQLTRPRPVIGPPTAQPENIVFTSKPVVIVVRPLPQHSSQSRVPVGSFRLEEVLERQRIGVEQSVRYTFTIAGEGNIATLPTPLTLNERADMDIFPPEERHTLRHMGNQVIGRKSFTYFIVPHQNGQVSLANRFQWIYFDPQTSRYDTLQPRLQLQVGGRGAIIAKNAASSVSITKTDGGEAPVGSVGNSIYAGIEAMDSTHQSINVSTLVRAVANVLIVIMLLGMIFVFFKK